MTDSAGKPTIEELEQDKKDSRLISALLLGEYSHEEAGKILIRLNSHAALVEENEELKLRARAAEDVVKRYVASYHRGKGFPQAWISENCGDLAKEEITKRLAELKEQNERA